MNRPTHFHNRHALQLAEALLKHELRAHVVARNEWLQPWAKAATVAAMRRLQLSLSPNLAGRFFDAAQIKAPWERHPWTPMGSGKDAREHARDLRAQPHAAPAVSATTRRKALPAPALPPSAQGRRAEVRSGCPVPLGAVAAWARKVRGDWHARPELTNRKDRPSYLSSGLPSKRPRCRTCRAATSRSDAAVEIRRDANGSKGSTAHSRTRYRPRLSPRGTRETIFLRLHMIGIF